MAIFSNLEGTMKNTFIIGKNGSTLVYLNGELRVMNYQKTDLIPISVANPTNNTHAVNLAYFNAHAGGGGGGNANILHGTTDPLPSLGEDTNVYFKLDSTSIVSIYFKDQNTWKPYAVPPVQDSNYVTDYIIRPSDWVLNGSSYQYHLSEETHNRGSNIIVQLQDDTGAVSFSQIVVDSSGNIEITRSTLPTGDYKIMLIGATTLTTPYSHAINKADWSLVSGQYQITINSSTHGQSSGPLFLSVLQNTIDGNTSSSPFEAISVDTLIDSNYNVTLKSSIQFSGKVIISGK